PKGQFHSGYVGMGNNPVFGVDPDGRWWHIVAGAAIGGVLNLAMNWNNIDNFGEGLASFGVGAAAGAATAACGSCGAALWIAASGGAATAATNNIVAQTNNEKGLNDVQWGSVGISGLSGFVAGVMGSAAGQLAGQGVGNLMINGFNVVSPVAKGVITGAVGGAAGGYAGGFAGTLMAGGNMATANKAGVAGASSGALIGGVAGGIGAYAAAKKANINPWTGVKNNSVTIGEGMVRVETVTKDLRNENINKDWPDQMDAYISKKNREFNSEAMDFNGEWIDAQMQKDVYIYDIQTPNKAPVSSPFYNMEQGRIMNYPNQSNTLYYRIGDNIRIIIFK
ncbi:MAG TPA: hypothetical protein VL088_07355, partial [Pedobacter sp.]|nr:hypothetical protein [Pedobacter sp.]